MDCKKYTEYLNNNNIKIIADNKIGEVVDKLYDDNKIILKDYIIKKLKKKLEINYPGDNLVNPLIDDMLNDEINAKTRIALEIHYYQETLLEKSSQESILKKSS